MKFLLLLLLSLPVFAEVTNECGQTAEQEREEDTICWEIRSDGTVWYSTTDGEIVTTAESMLSIEHIEKNYVLVP